jgi:hypothetical protein
MLNAGNITDQTVTAAPLCLPRFAQPIEYERITLTVTRTTALYFSQGR